MKRSEAWITFWGCMIIGSLQKDMMGHLCWGLLMLLYFLIYLQAKKEE